MRKTLKTFLPVTSKNSASVVFYSSTLSDLNFFFNYIKITAQIFQGGESLVVLLPPSENALGKSPILKYILTKTITKSSWPFHFHFQTRTLHVFYIFRSHFVEKRFFSSAQRMLKII
jgi:hypothetical protein